MTERQIENRVKKLREIESQRKALEEKKGSEGRNQKGHGKQGPGRNPDKEFHHPLERDHQQHA